MLELFTKHVGVVQQTISQAKRKTKKTKITHTFNQTKDQSSKQSDKHTINQIKRTTKKQNEKTRNKKPYIKNYATPDRPPPAAAMLS